jgi:hypothetical protein
LNHTTLDHTTLDKTTLSHCSRMNHGSRNISGFGRTWRTGDQSPWALRGPNERRGRPGCGRHRRSGGRTGTGRTQGFGSRNRRGWRGGRRATGKRLARTRDNLPWARRWRRGARGNRNGTRSLRE